MPSPEYKHFCRVCNKGFICGSALGGHMRAHSSSDDVFAGAGADDGDEPARGRGPSDDQWDAAGTSSSTTHAYALRANPNRQVRSCQVCKNCGKEFTSWERFLDHGRCNSDDEGRAEGSGSPRHSLSPSSEADDGEEDPAVSATEWSKGKRSRRVKSVAALDDAPATSSRRFMSGEEEDLANCLVMLSSSNTEQAATVTRTNTQQKQSASVSRERDRGDRGPQLLHQISFLPQAPDPVMALPSATTTIQYVSPAPRGMFECKACKKEFTSHQALGGHRASHKKVKGCFAARLESNVSKTPSHAAPVDRNEDNGKAVVVEGSTHATTDAKPSCNAGTDGDTNVRTTSETAAALSMALAPVAAFNVAEAPSGKKNAKMHECSVCHRLFTSGQALGGHKRCHLLTSSTADPTIPVANLSVPPITEDLVGAVRHQLMLRPMVDASEPALDLTISAKPSTLTPAPGSSTFHLDASAQALHLQSSVEPGNASHRNTCGHDDNDVAATASNAAQDESESISIKRARLTDLKDVVRMDEEASEPWLQVGIGSSSAGGDEKNSRE